MSLDLLELLDLLDDRVVRQAFTHASLVEDRGRSYERLEFLGDSVLSLCITGELYRRFPRHSEGHLARLRAYVVSRETCARVAEELELGRRLERYAPAHHDAAEIAQLARTVNVLADLTESVIGAAYLTFGFEAVRPGVVAAFDEHIAFAERSHVDNKTELQERLAKSSRSVTYRLVEQSGPAHDRRFEIEAVIDGEVMGRGRGQSKKRAEQMAAGEVLNRLGEGDKRPAPRRVRLLARRPRAGSRDGVRAEGVPAAPEAGERTGDVGRSDAGDASPAGDDAPAPKRAGRSRRSGSGRS